mgnify:CR=1 FL=1
MSQGAGLQVPWSRSHTWARQVMALAWTEVRYGGWNSGQDLLTANIDTNSDQGARGKKWK